MEKLTKYQVKGISSGDTIKLSGALKAKSDELPKEITFRFALLQSPKVANGNGYQEQPFGFEARQFVRDMLKEKVVKIKVDYTINDVSYGQAFLDNKNIAFDIVERGYAKVGYIGKDAQHLENSDYLKKIRKLEKQAAENKVGIHDDPSNARLKGTGPEELLKEELNDLVGKKDVKGMIAYVVNCAIYSVYLYEQNTFVKLSLRYVATPSSKDEPQLYKARRACAERFALNRDVSVDFKAFDGETFEAIVTMGDEDLACRVLKEGLSCIYFGADAGYTIEEIEAVKSAQRAAQLEGIRHWKDSADALKKQGKAVANIETQIISVQSGDAINVYIKGMLTRVFLSHVRAPALAKPKTKDPNETWAWQSREHLRTALVGQVAKLEFDFAREIETQGVKRNMIFFSVFKKVNKEWVNMNEEMIAKGLGKYMPPGRNDDNTSKYLSVYSKADGEAKAGKRGIYSPKNPGDPCYSDLQYANRVKVDEFKDFLVNSRNLPSVIEYCNSGTRFKLRVERNKCIVPFNLIGLKSCTSDPNNTKDMNDFYERAVKYVNLLFLQREAKADILQADRVGNYFGYLTVEGESVHSLLLKEGLAVINIVGNSKIDNLEQLEKDEATAKEEKRGVWAHPDIINVLKDGYVEKAGEITPCNKKVSLSVTDYANMNDFSINVKPNDALEKISKLITRDTDSIVPLERPIKKNTNCIVLCSLDDEYYRAKVLKSLKDSELEVELYDYGTIDVVQTKNTTKMSPELMSIPPQGIYAEFAYLKFSRNSKKIAINRNPDFVDLEKERKAVVLYTKVASGRDKYGLVLFKGDSLKETYHWEFLEQGLACITDHKSLPEEFKPLIDIEKAAKNAGKGIWSEGMDDSDGEY